MHPTFGIKSRICGWIDILQWCPSVPKKSVHFGAILGKTNAEFHEMASMWDVCAANQHTCFDDSTWSLPQGHQDSTDGEAELPLTVQAGLELLGEGKRHNTYKNFPFVFDPIRTICSDSSREIFPWNQGIFSWAVVAISFSSWGFWLIMACSRAWPCHEEKRVKPYQVKVTRKTQKAFPIYPKSWHGKMQSHLFMCLYVHSIIDPIYYLSAFKYITNKIDFRIQRWAF